MVKWLRDFWFHDTIDVMQQKMLLDVPSNRPSLENMVRISAKRGKTMALYDAINRAATLERYLRETVARG